MSTASNAKLTRLAKKLQKVDIARKKIEAERDALKAELFIVAAAENKTKTLPRKVITIEASFWKKTKLSEAHFFATRFPSWNIVGKESNEQQATFILERDPHFVPWSYTDEESLVRIGKRISESAPDIDWNTLAAEDEALFARLAKPKVIYELDKVEFEKVMAAEPDALSVLSRHLTTKRPTESLAPIRIVKDIEEE